MVAEWVKEGLTEARAAARLREILVGEDQQERIAPSDWSYKDVFIKKDKPNNNKELVQDMVKKISRKMKMPR